MGKSRTCGRKADLLKMLDDGIELESILDDKSVSMALRWSAQALFDAKRRGIEHLHFVADHKACVAFYVAVKERNRSLINHADNCQALHFTEDSSKGNQACIEGILFLNKHAPHLLERYAAWGEIYGWYHRGIPATEKIKALDAKRTAELTAQAEAKAAAKRRKKQAAKNRRAARARDEALVSTPEQLIAKEMPTPEAHGLTVLSLVPEIEAESEAYAVRTLKLIPGPKAKPSPKDPEEMPVCQCEPCSEHRRYRMHVGIDRDKAFNELYPEF